MTDTYDNAHRALMHERDTLRASLERAKAARFDAEAALEDITLLTTHHFRRGTPEEELLRDIGESARAYFAALKKGAK